MATLLNDNITLTEELFYSAVHHKKCYVHPTVENLFIKSRIIGGDKQIH